MTDSKSDIVKKSKLDRSLVGAGTLNNHDSVDNILQCLFSPHQYKLSAYYTGTVRHTDLMTKPLLGLHHLVPGYSLKTFSEDWDGGLKHGYFENFGYKSLKPKFITPNVKHIGEPDPVTELLRKKLDWHGEWFWFRNCRLIYKKLSHEWHDENTLHCSKVYVDAAEHWERDPDRLFNSSYNWYYAGNGNMKIISIYGIDYLLHSEFNIMYLSAINTKTLQIDNQNEVIYDCSGRIFETIYLQNIIALRLKHMIIILKINVSEGDIKLEKLKHIESQLPFTSISFDDYHKNILYVVTIDYKLTIINLDRMVGRSKQLKGKISLVDNWNMVIGSERPYYTHVTKGVITLYDKRTNYAFIRWKNLKNIIDNTSCCDITAAKYCKGQPLLYLTTDHHMFLMDMRHNRKEDRKVKAVQRWTHGMQVVPTYIELCNFEYNKQLICLSSQWCEDMCVISDYADRLVRNNDVPGICMPYRPPSVFAALYEVRQANVTIDDSIQNRINSAITGQAAIRQDDNYFILLQNSFGDISYHTLIRDDKMIFLEDDGVEEFCEWSKGYKLKEKPLHVSYIKDVKDMWMNLKKMPDDFVPGVKVPGRQSKFDEKDIFKDFEEEKLDPALQEIWIDKGDEEISQIEEAQGSQSFFFSGD